MDEKDPKDEELNPKGQDDINDADDSFGLPDLEYKPLDDDSEEPDSDESNTDSNEDSDATTMDDEVESNETDQVEESTDSFSNDSSLEESDTSETSEDDKEKPQLRYQIEEKSSSAPKIIGGIVGVLLVAVVIWYFGFYRPEQQKITADEKARQEIIDNQKVADAAALKKQQDADAEAAAEEARLKAEADELAKAGVQILEERTGRYYIVLESFIDGDFAKDFGDKIAKEGTPSFLIPPYSKKKMQRVGIGGYESIDDAKMALNELPDEFGKGKWILKY